MNEKLLDIIVCPHCDDPQRLRIEDDQWYCSVCGRGDRVIQHKPVLCSISSDEAACARYGHLLAQEKLGIRSEIFT